MVLNGLVLVCFRLRKFDPDNDEESLSNLETQCDVKEDMQPLHGSCMPVDSVNYMESGMYCIIDTYLQYFVRVSFIFLSYYQNAFLYVEQQDVHNFLLHNMTNGGILDLLMRYLKAVGQKFMEEWPRGLADVVLEVYQTWRNHSSGLPNPLFRDSSNQHIRVRTLDQEH